MGDVDELKPLLKDVAMRLFELEVLLPKASLMGSGVSLRAGFGYDHGVGREMKGPSAYSMVLRLRDLKVPTLVGVNPNERLAKQIVYVDVEMQRWDWMVDGYCALEEIVVKVCFYFIFLFKSLYACFLFMLTSHLRLSVFERGLVI